MSNRKAGTKIPAFISISAYVPPGSSSVVPSLIAFLRLGGVNTGRLKNCYVCDTIISENLNLTACKVMLRNCKVDAVVVGSVFCHNEITK